MKYTKANLLKALKISEELDKKQKFKESDYLLNKIFKLAQEAPFELREGLDTNDPKSVMDYFIGFAFDMYSRKKDISKKRLEMELSKLVDDKISEMSEENKVKYLNLKNEVLDELTNQAYWDELPEETITDMDSKSIGEDPKNFIDKLSSSAQQASEKFDNVIPPSFIIALAAWESGWGKSKLASQYGNYFGIKQSPTSGAQTGVSMGTFEYYDGAKTRERAEFAVFGDDAVSSMSALPNFLINNPRYSNALRIGQRYKDSKSINDLHDMIDAIFAAGYSTDPNEPGNIKKLINRYNLTQFD